MAPKAPAQVPAPPRDDAHDEIQPDEGNESDAGSRASRDSRASRAARRRDRREATHFVVAWIHNKGTARRWQWRL